MGCVDNRIAVHLGPAPMAAGQSLAWLIEGDGPTPGPVVERFVAGIAHGFSCRCCAGRSPAAQALGRLFLRRARGEVALFSAVVVRCETAQGEAAVRAALAGDVLARARFTLAPG
jgi:hypothetical protein